jgi:hypothetical protein
MTREAKKAVQHFDNKGCRTKAVQHYDIKGSKKKGGATI